MRFKAVIFDMDGVIFDSEYAGFLCWKELSEKFGFSDDFENTYHRVIGTSREYSRRVFKECYGDDFPCDKYEDMRIAMCRERYSGGRMPKKKGVFEILEHLKNANIFTALATSTYSSIVTPLLDESGLAAYFDMIVSGDMIARSKPAPEIFIKVSELSGIAPCDCAVIEDSYNGIRAASAAGMFPIMVPDMLPPDEEMHEKAGIILPDLLAVKDFFISSEV